MSSAGPAIAGGQERDAQPVPAPPQTSDALGLPPLDASRRKRLLLALMSVAAALRLVGLGSASLWYDEALTHAIALQPLNLVAAQVAWAEQLPPLWHFLMHFWTSLAGDSEFAMRLPSAAFGVAAVYVCFRLGEEMLGPWHGLLAATLLAVAPFQVHYAQEARPYSLLLLLSLASCLCFWRLVMHYPSLKRRTRRRLWAGLVVAGALLLWTHLYGALLLVAENVFFAAMLLTRRRKDLPTWWRWAVSQALIIALFAPWLPMALSWTRRVANKFWVQPFTADEISRVFWVYAGSGVTWLALAGLALLTIAATLRPRDELARRRRPAIWFLVAMIALTVAVPIVVSLMVRPMFVHRYGIAAPAALYLLAAVAALNLLRPRAIGVAVVALAALLPWLKLDAPDDPARKPDWRGAGTFLSRNMQPGDSVAINNGLSLILYSYYVNRPDVEEFAFTEKVMPVARPPRRGTDVWLVLYDSTATLTELLRDGRWDVKSVERFDGVDVFQLGERTMVP